MADIVLTRDERGKLAGLTQADQRRWSKFMARVKSMGVGDTLKASFKIPRSPKFHRRHFALLKALFDCQEQFTDFDRFREWVQVGAGFCDIVPGPKGRAVAISKSIAWEALGDEEFAEHHLACIDFIRSPHFSRFLWGHLDERQQADMVEAVLQEFSA